LSLKYAGICPDYHPFPRIYVVPRYPRTEYGKAWVKEIRGDNVSPAWLKVQMYGDAKTKET
jgi:hypothetical protein